MGGVARQGVKDLGGRQAGELDEAQSVNAELQQSRFGPPFLRFLQRWLVNTVAVLVAANVVPGIQYEGWPSLLVASLVLGVLNALLRPLLLILSLPLVVFSLGLFVLVINALLLGLVGQVVGPFHVEGFWAAFFGALVISLTTIVLNTLTGSGESRIDLRNPSRRQHPPPRRPPPPERPPPGKGPVIDV